MIKEIIQKKAGLLGIIAAFLCLTGVAVMFWRNTQELLWSYWSLVVLFFGWWAFFLLWKRKALKDNQQLKYLKQATISGILLGLAFPFSNIPTGVLALIAWIPFFRMIERQVEEGLSLRKIYFFALHTFVLWNIIATYWVANSSFPAGLFAIFVNSALMGLPVLLQIKARKIMPRLKWVPFLAFWLSFEYMHYNWELNWPWLSLGNVWSTAPGLIQWYSITGVLGGSLWILILNILGKDVYEGFMQKSSKRPLFLIRLSTVLFIPILISVIQFTQFQDDGEQVNLAVIQPNIEPFYEAPSIDNTQVLNRLIDLGRQHANQETQYIVYPEATLEFINQRDIKNAAAVVQLQQSLLEPFPKASIIIGADAYRFLAPNEETSRYTRTQIRNGETNYFEIYNAALQLQQNADSIAFYKKSKLVPGAELFPYPNILRFLKPLVESLGGTMAGRGAQKERSVFQKGDLKIAPAICYESVFGKHLAQHVQNGAQAIFIITNDAWWDNTAGHIQHFHFARLRAIENRRTVARAANTGISGFINAKGQILNRTAYRETTGVQATVYFNQQYTFYSQNPDFLARFALFASLAFILNWIARTLLTKD